MSNWMVKGNTLKNYLEVCQDAVNDDSCFDNFKKDPRYTTILEHCNRNIAQNYLEQINKDNPILLKEELKENDSLGNPKVETFVIGKTKYVYKYSTSTLQYIGVLSNLLNEYKTLRNWNIVEIGGGYGGQCKVIQDYEKSNKYTLIDLLEPSLLQEKYLNRLLVENIDCYSSEDYPKNIKYDLVISNYALSEVLEPLQTQYIKDICLNSKHGYLTCNVELKSFHLLKENFPNLRIEKDIKGEVETNFIIIW